MELETKNESESRSIPNVAPSWSELRKRSPYKSEVRDDPSGGVIVHRCHPDGEATDYFAFAMRHETMKGYVDKNTYLFDGPVEDGEGPAVRTGIGRWDSAVGSFHFREGSHEDCGVCQGNADRRELVKEVMETATQQVGGEHNVAKTGVYERTHGSKDHTEGIVYVDSHGMATESGPYSVDNATRHWEGRVVAHPYVQFGGAEEVGEGGNAHSPDNTLKVTLVCHFPARGPEVRL